MQILFFNPPCTVYDRTLHYFQATFAAVAGYLRSQLPDCQVQFEAAGLTGATSRTLVRHFVGLGPDSVLILWCRVWEAPSALALARLARELAPELPILVWGDAVTLMPQYFRRAPFDGLVISGDPEIVLRDAVRALQKGVAPEHGLEWRGRELPVGQILSGEEWPFPALDWLDPLAYRSAREGRGKVFDDLSFTVSRGCPINCAPWCSTPRKEGVVDRRRPVRATVDYLQGGCAPYQMFQLHTPLLACNAGWLEEFIVEKGRRCPHVPFKSVDVLGHYTEQRVAALASVGLRGLGFGVETLSARSRRLIAKADEQRLREVARWLHRHGVEGKAYTQLGLPGQSREDILYTQQLLLDLGLKPRPTGATPFHRLRRLSIGELDGLDLSQWDRKSFYSPGCGLSKQEFYQLLMSGGEERRWAA